MTTLSTPSFSRSRHRLAVFWLTLVFTIAGQSLAQTTLQVPSPPEINARSYVLQDFHSGQILAQKNADQRVEPASITKLMTAYVVFNELANGNLKEDEKVTISEKAWRTGGSKMFIEVGKQVPVIDLLKGMVIQSGNDASVALAEHIAGSEETFASMMNQQAQRLGMHHSHFANATGLPHEDHYVTAADVAKLAAALVRDFPDYYKLFSEKQFTYNGITQHNRNTLLWRDPSVDGLKTGHTKSAGYCLAASAKRNGMRLISAVMGTESEKARADETQKLLNYGFRFFETHQLYKKGDPDLTVDVWKGEKETVKLGLGDDLFVTIPRGQYKKLSADVKLPRVLEAPVAQGQKIGVLKLGFDGKPLLQRDLLAKQSVATGGWWTRLTDSIGLWFKSFGDDDE
jgi:D-alanyl-D-alanine carboxypeptidase (penicillin-binding protein 5/6)